MDLAYYRSLLRRAFGDRSWLVVGGPLVALAPLGRMLGSLDAQRPFLLASERGTGVPPETDEAEVWSLGLRVEGGVMEAVRTYEHTLADLPADARAAVERYDPDHRAQALGLIVLAELPDIAGRRRYAARRPEWIALEDKVAIDAFWDRAGVARAPCEIVAAEPRALRAAAARLDRGHGTVWATDASAGPHGGGAGLRWVRDGETATETAAQFATRSERVRVMPFLEGIPCSIHGIVCPDGDAVFRPVELLILRRPDDRLLYAGAATFWDPPVAAREAMRATARRVARHLREEVDYRGAFTVDGVLTDDGFLPTELNPRIGHGLMVQGASLPELPLGLLALAAIEEDAELHPAELERIVVEAADARRAGAGATVLPEPREHTESWTLIDTPSGYGWSDDEHHERAVATVALGSSIVGSYLQFTPAPEHVANGPSFAPRVAEAFALADTHLGTGLGPLRWAQPART